MELKALIKTKIDFFVYKTRVLLKKPLTWRRNKNVNVVLFHEQILLSKIHELYYK